MASDPVARHFFNGFIRLHILYHAAKEPIYGAEIAEELIRHGYRLSQGTLYPTLHALEELRYLRCESQLVAGRRRIYYRATPKGRRALDQARGKLLELVAEVVEDHDGAFQALRRQRSKRPSAKRARESATRRR
jgi:PadR family transcriptional regulator